MSLTTDDLEDAVWRGKADGRTEGRLNMERCAARVVADLVAGAREAEARGDSHVARARIEAAEAVRRAFRLP